MQILHLLELHSSTEESYRWDFAVIDLTISICLCNFLVSHKIIYFSYIVLITKKSILEEKTIDITASSNVWYLMH